MSASTASEEHGSSRALARSSAVMASGTLVSRVLGLARMALLAWAIGNLTPAANVWETANTIPNAIFLLLAAGVLNVLLLPQLTRAMVRGREGQEYSDRLLTLSVALLVVGTLLFWAATPLVTKLNALAWAWGSPELTLAIMFAYFCIPQMLFYGLHTVLGQVLAAHHRFAAYMWSPALANVVQILGILLFAWRYPTANQVPPEGWTFPMIALLGGSATLGIVLQALVLFPAVRATGFQWRPRWGFRGVGLGTAGVMAFWAFAEVGLSQGGMLAVNNLLAWAVVDVPEAAGRNVYFYAFSVFMLPHSLLALSLLTALYPVLSKAAAAGDLRGMANRAETGLRMLLTAMVPIAVGMMLLAPLLVRVIYPFSTDAAHAAIAPVVQAFTIGLIPYGVYLLCSRVFYSFEDARTPFFFQVALTTTLLLATLVALTQPETRAAVLAAAGQGVGQVIAAGIGLYAVRRRLPDLQLRPAATTLARALLASLVALLPAWGLVRVLDRPGLLGAVVALAVSGVVYLALYGVLALVLRVGEVRTVAAPLLRRVPGLSRFAPSSGELEVIAAEATGPVPGDPGQGEPTAAGVHPGGPVGQFAPATTSTPTSTPTSSPTSAASSSPATGEGTLGGQDAPDGVPHGGEDSTMDRLEVGARLGDRYALEELLAEREGSGLQYWSARDVTLDRLVAVTALPSSGEDAVIAEAVLDGARRVASVDDPRLVRVLDVGNADGICWVVEEGLTEAESLASLVAEQPLPAEEVRRLVGEAAAGLESARRRGLHHLYLNPHSILRTTDGTVKVSGVGVASALEGTDDVTSDEASIIDTADLVSLLYTGLTGRWPGEDLPGVRTARRLADDSLPAPSELVAGVPGDLDALCRMVHGSGTDLSSAPHTPGELARQLSPWSSEMVRGPRPGELTAPTDTQERGGLAATDALTAAAGASAAATAAHPTRAEDVDVEGAKNGDHGDETSVVPQAYYRTSRRAAPADENAEMDGLFASGERAAQEHDARERARTQAVPVGAAAAGASMAAGGPSRAGSGGAGTDGSDDGPDDSGGLDEARGTGLQTAAVIGVILAILAGAFLMGWFLIGGLGGEDEPSGGGTTASAPVETQGGGDTDVATATEDAGGQTASPEPQQTEEPPAAAPDGEVSIVGITSFDPEGDNNERNDLTPLAVDGDPGTAWRSHTYLSPNWGSLKSGVGLILDLGEGATVSEVEVELDEAGVGASLWLSEEPTREGGTELGSGSDLEGTWTVAPESPATGRYLILWFDTAATTEAGEVVGVREIVVR